MQAEGSDVIAESRPGVGERVARADLVSDAAIDLGITSVAIRATYRPGTLPDSALSTILLSGLVTALAGGYATFASFRYRQALVVRARSERRRAELMTSRFHAAVDDAPVGVVIAGLDGSIEVANDRIRDLMRVPEIGRASCRGRGCKYGYISVVAV